MGDIEREIAPLWKVSYGLLLALGSTVHLLIVGTELFLHGYGWGAEKLNVFGME